MKTRIIIILACAIAAISCSERKVNVEVIPIQDDANPRLMPRTLFSEAPDSLMAALGLEDGVPASVCAFLVKTADKNILFDAANGAPDSRLLPFLDSCGLSSDMIDCIFITHLHGDHIGGLVNDGESVFANAELYINRIEYDAWMEMEQSAALKEIVMVYGDRLKTFDVTDDLPCGVEPVEAYGHTPGHTAYKVGTSIIVGDIMHGVALQKGHPQYCARFDMDQEQSVATRKEIMNMAQENGLKVYGMHFPAPYYL